MPRSNRQPRRNSFAHQQNLTRVPAMLLVVIALSAANAAPPRETGGTAPRSGGPPIPPALRFDAAVPDAASSRSTNSIASTDAEEAERISRDPFQRPPQDLLRSLSEVRVALDTPAAATQSETAIEKRGVVTLAPHAWPACTPEAAAYRFSCAPLWYEDANLERCGYSYGCCQPLVSGAYFFGNTATLPYRLVAESQCDRVPVKSFCPPGYRYSCVDNYFPEPDAAGGTAQALAITGLIFLIP